MPNLICTFICILIDFGRNSQSSHAKLIVLKILVYGINDLKMFAKKKKINFFSMKCWQWFENLRTQTLYPFLAGYSGGHGGWSSGGGQGWSSGGYSGGHGGGHSGGGSVVKVIKVRISYLFCEEENFFVRAENYGHALYNKCVLHKFNNDQMRC